MKILYSENLKIQKLNTYNKDNFRTTKCSQEKFFDPQKKTSDRRKPHEKKMDIRGYLPRMHDTTMALDPKVPR